MPKILKILTGPQEGAELELDAGIALHIGTDDSNDIVLVDAMAPAQALELIMEGDNVSVTASAERLFAGDAALPVGEKTALPDYTILTIGSTRCAVGDADKAWPPLRWIPLDVLLAEKTQPQEEEKTEEPKTNEPKAEQEEAPLSREQVEKLDELQSNKRAKHSLGFAILSWLILILTWSVGMWFTGRHVWNLAKPQESQSIVENTRQTRLEKLREKAEALNLTMEEDEDGNLTRITGNVSKTSQRTSIEQIVKYDCPNVVCEMTDDETLARSVKELVWGLTEGRLQLVSLKDRVAKLMGMTNNEEEWNTIVDNIRHDIPRLATVESDVVFADVMAAKLREALAQTGFRDVRVEILPGELQFVGYAPKESRQTFAKLLEEAVKYFPENAKLTNMVKWKDSETPVDGEEPAAPKARQLPITGIVVHPYPCVILADGQRLGKGSLVGGYTIDDISLTEVSLSKEDEKLTWRP
ncbi:MAG: hypothetical protein K6G44_08255 [Lentisphaeria bacterium]|nr:hypothetical protein [Lentisphaeria bacterium]